jgi:hypothetical protein
LLKGSIPIRTFADWQENQPGFLEVDLGLNSDKGSEFINQPLYTYRQREGITFTRSRSYNKNDSCHVEQKNWSVVRRLVGYDRYSSRAALQTLNRLYVNFFQPVGTYFKVKGEKLSTIFAPKRIEEAKRLKLLSLHPGVSIEQIEANSKFETLIPEKIAITKPPTEEECKILRELDPLRGSACAEAALQP